MSSRGPLVPRGAHPAAYLYLVGSVQFVVAMAVTQIYYPGYSDASNAISDLGDPGRSSASLLFNGSLIALGLLGLAATALLKSSLRPRGSSYAGLLLLGIGLVGAIGAGVFHEPSSYHGKFAETAFVGGGLALSVLALAMLRDTRWDGLRAFTLLSGLVTLGAIGVLASPLATSADFGAVERVVVAPLLLWAVVIGLHLLRLPVYKGPDPATS
ncbi:MAG TPA: DUF998 domain-containing protein [Thermoplasmata archaeon]|nr:DUF998 domain-containing protein [Thermoplasmata archaeon]